MSTGRRFDKDDLRRIAHDAMEERGLLPDFSSAVMAETNRITKAATPAGADVRDLRDLPWASIDNDDSRDLDQLTVAQPVADGTVRILVAIADVDALVKKDSAIDGHAWTNTTSVYTPAGIFPMLPEKLSTDLTSLGEGEERLAIVDRDGDRGRRHRDGLRHLPGQRSQPRQARLQRRRGMARRHGAGAAEARRGSRVGGAAAHPGSGRAGAAAAFARRKAR